MGGADTTQQTQSQQVQQLPPWINDAAQQNYAFAQNVANRPLQQYQGQMVADLGPQQQQAFNLAGSSGNVGQNQYDASQAGYLGVLGQQPQQVAAGQLSNTNLSPYMNPYTQDVINATLPIMQQQLGQQMMGNQANATQQGAFGGSRAAVQQGVTQAQGAMDMAQMAAQLNQANFTQAQGAAGQDIASRMQAALANQQAQQNQGGLNLQAAQGLGGLGQQAQLNQARNFTELMTAGQAEQQQAQNQINAQQQKFQNAWGYPTQQLGALQSALGMTPYGTATQGNQVTTTQTSANPLQAGLSGLETLGGLFGSGGAFPLFPASDRRLKTDITRIGTHPSGIPIHAYRYKGDPKSYPKVVGPMAEDVAKIAPQAVFKIPGSGGKRGIHMGLLNAATQAPRGASAAGMPSLGGVPGGPPMGAPMGPLAMGGGPLTPPAPLNPRRVRPPSIRGALGG
jgi:hypothetical protein